MTFHFKLIELEAEVLAKQQSAKGFQDLPVECSTLLHFIEQEIGLRLADKVPKDWHGWLCYKRNRQSLVICRGRAFKEGAFSPYRAGLDVPNGLDSITEQLRGLDVTPPQDLDHLLINFGGTVDEPKLFAWYGENIAPYKLIYMADVAADPHVELSAMIVEGCTWIMTRPKHQTLLKFLQEQGKTIVNGQAGS